MSLCVTGEVAELGTLAPILFAKKTSFGGRKMGADCVCACTA